MKLWKIMYAEGDSLGMAVVFAPTANEALEEARLFALREKLSGYWIDRASVKEIQLPGDGKPAVLAWAES